MFQRRTLGWPITLGVIMIVLLVALIVVWVLLTVSIAYWALLSSGSVLLVLVIVGTVMYLSLSIKAINLSRRQSNFIDSVTHELKSPIASLKLYLQTLNRHQTTPEEQQEFFHGMMEDVERLDQLINHLLDAARLEHQPLESDVDEVDLAHVLIEAANSACLRYRVPPETIHCELTPCFVRAQRADLDMIFRNLIDNAIKYGGATPHVEISLSREARNRVVVRIADNGQGIPASQRRNIFGRFERLGLELERPKPGTGLGLYIVRTLLGRLRGRIRVRDRDSGSGTVFEVTLPAESGEIPAAPAKVNSKESK
jgi:signal transduction histidine kinase